MLVSDADLLPGPVFRVSEESTTTDDFMRGEKAEVRQKMFSDYSIHPERAQLASNWWVTLLLVVVVVSSVR